MNSYDIEEIISQRTEKILRAGRNLGLSIILVTGDRTITIHEPTTIGGAAPRMQRAPAKCLSKIFTAMIIAGICDARKLTAENQIKDFGLKSFKSEQIAKLQISQLLNQSHGLDAVLPAAGVIANGHVNVGELESVAARANFLFKPGAMFSYSDLGFWLAAAIAEEHFCDSFCSVLTRHLVATRIIKPEEESSCVLQSELSEICPSTGGSLSFSTDELVGLVRYLLDSESNVVSFLVGHPVEYPGWNPVEQSSRCGFVEYGDGWFGQNGTDEKVTTTIRVNPTKKIGLILRGSNSSFSASTELLRGVLPEYDRWYETISVLSSNSVRPANDSIAGVYESATARVFIERTSSSSEELKIRFSTASVPLGEDPSSGVRLIPAKNGVFFTRPLMRYFPFVQSVEEESSRTRYLWNGKQVFPKESTTIVQRSSCNSLCQP